MEVTQSFVVDNFNPHIEPFERAIDNRFGEVLGREKTIPKNPLEREHEQVIELIPGSILPGLSPRARVYATRSIPGQEEKASKKWPVVGGHRITAYEQGGEIYTDFFVSRSLLMARRQTCPRRLLKAEQVELMKERKEAIDHLTVLSLRNNRQPIFGTGLVGAPIRGDREFSEALITWVEGSSGELVPV